MKKTKLKKRAAQRVPRRKPAERDVRKATERFIEENEDILFAVEAMERVRLAQETRVRHLLDRMGYHVVGTL